MDQNHAVLTWQGPTGTTNTIEVASGLAATPPFEPLVHLPVPETLRSYPVPVDTGTNTRFFRITQP